ncbi:hypothetical protein [Aequorivita capsosiphonis]|uniref:hypothetical protein n=1 Tax=Aequorivita capsosiphonis TaxID=487317 RepID=UPI0004218800|nr:hypothetical protein [Aequorivita capsosiphonis]
MSELTIKLIIILIPGAIATLIFGKLILHKEWSSFRFVLYSILFGIISYLFLQLIINGLNLFYFVDLHDLTIWSTLNNATLIPYQEVGFASIVSILIALIASMIENRKVINRVAGFFGISAKYGDENLYSMFLNSKNVQFIYLRDIKNQLTYHGWVKSFSENDGVSEIRLADVAIYNYSDSKFLYEVSEIYLSLNKHEIIIEIANLKENGQKATKQK